MMKGEVIAGDFQGCLIASGNNYLYIQGHSEYTLTKNNISHYEIVSQDTSKSASSAVARGAIGGLLLGPVGLLAGASAKNKASVRIAIQWINGKRSLIELTSKYQIDTFYRCNF